MTAYAFYSNIPAAANYPGNDQPNMLTNNINLPLYLAVDHVPFGTTSNGYHKQVTIPAFTSPSTPTDPFGVLFTNSQIAYSSSPALNWITSHGTCQLNLLACYACFSATYSSPNWTTSITSGQKINITLSALPSSRSSLVLQFTASSIIRTGKAFAVIISNDSNATYTYSVTGLVVTVTFVVPGLTSTTMNGSILLLQA